MKHFLLVCLFMTGLLLSFSCGSVKTTGQSVDTDGSTQGAEGNHSSCTTDSDCVIACSAKKVCCGEMCECNDAINQRWHTEIREWQRANCSPKECPMADCEPPKFDHHPQCIDGQCVDQQTPWIPPHQRKP